MGSLGDTAGVNQARSFEKLPKDGGAAPRIIPVDVAVPVHHAADSPLHAPHE